MVQNAVGISVQMFEAQKADITPSWNAWERYTRRGINIINTDFDLRWIVVVMMDVQPFISTN